MITFELELELEPWARFWDTLLRSQLPFARARALTWTAQDAQRALREELGRHFTIRNRYVERGVRIRPARKGPAPQAVVGHLAPFMALQALGGTKKGSGRGGQVAVPLLARKTPSAKTSPKKHPGPFVRKDPTRRFYSGIGSDRDLVIWRKGSARRPRMERYWLLVPQVNVPAAWPFLATVERVVSATWVDNARRSLEDAVEDARRRARA